MTESAAPAGGRVVAADGSITYSFDGHVRAQGLDMDRYTIGYTIPEAPQRFTLPNSKITWWNNDNTESASIHGELDTLVLRQEVRAGAGPGSAAVVVKAGGQSARIIGDDGSSDFARWEEGLRRSDVVVAGFGLTPGQVASQDIVHNLGY